MPPTNLLRLDDEVGSFLFLFLLEGSYFDTFHKFAEMTLAFDNNNNNKKTIDDRKKPIKAINWRSGNAKKGTQQPITVFSFDFVSSSLKWMALRDDASGCCVAAITSVLFLSFSFLFFGVFFLFRVLVRSFFSLLPSIGSSVACRPRAFTTNWRFLFALLFFVLFLFFYYYFFFGPENGRTRFSTPVRGKLFGNGRRASIFEAGHSVGP